MTLKIKQNKAEILQSCVIGEDNIKGLTCHYTKRSTNGTAMSYRSLRPKKYSWSAMGFISKGLVPAVTDSKHAPSVDQYVIPRSGALYLNLLRKSVSSNYMKDSDSCS